MKHKAFKRLKYRLTEESNTSEGKKKERNLNLYG